MIREGGYALYKGRLGRVGPRKAVSVLYGQNADRYEFMFPHPIRIFIGKMNGSQKWSRSIPVTWLLSAPRSGLTENGTKMTGPS